MDGLEGNLKSRGAFHKGMFKGLALNKTQNQTQTTSLGCGIGNMA